jgi:hypothetical protein
MRVEEQKKATSVYTLNASSGKHEEDNGLFGTLEAQHIPSRHRLVSLASIKI